MADILIRAIPDADAVRIAAQAARAGVSQSEYLRRIIREAVGRADLGPLADVAGSATGLFPERILDDLDDEWTM